MTVTETFSAKTLAGAFKFDTYAQAVAFSARCETAAMTDKLEQDREFHFMVDFAGNGHGKWVVCCLNVDGGFLGYH